MAPLVPDADTSRTRDEAITEILTRSRSARLTALTGLRTILDGREMRPAFQVELVERGTLMTEIDWRGPPGSVQLYRPVAAARVGLLAPPHPQRS